MKADVKKIALGVIYGYVLVMIAVGVITTFSGAIFNIQAMTIAYRARLLLNVLVDLVACAALLFVVLFAVVGLFTEKNMFRSLAFVLSIVAMGIFALYFLIALICGFIEDASFTFTIADSLLCLFYVAVVFFLNLFYFKEIKNEKAAVSAASPAAAPVEDSAAPEAEAKDSDASEAETAS